MNIPYVQKVIFREQRFVASIEAECEKRNEYLYERLENCETEVEAENLLLDQVKFIGQILEALRRRNQNLAKELGMNYAKIVGLVTPYEEAIHSMRKVKRELDVCLKLLREHMIDNMKKQFNVPRRYKKKIMKQNARSHERDSKAISAS
jgi:hypothetical protein